MASPGDETAAGAESHTRLRASAADREQVIELLKVAFVQDRITKDELDQRIGKVLASRTYDDLDVLTADIPTGLTRAQPTEPARPSDNGKKVIWRASAALGGTVFVTAEAAAIPYMAGSDAETRTVAGADVTTSLRPGRPRTGFTSR